MKLKVSLRFIRPNVTEDHDDILNIYEDEEFRTMYRLEYQTPEVKGKKYRFYLDERSTLDHVSDILKSMLHDADPFEHIQVQSFVQPSVLYHVSDMDDRSIRWQLEDAVRAAMVRPVLRVKA